MGRQIVNYNIRMVYGIYYGILWYIMVYGIYLFTNYLFHTYVCNTSVGVTSKKRAKRAIQIFIIVILHFEWRGSTSISYVTQSILI